MFTGIITDVGEIVAMEARGDTRFSIACNYDAASIDLGASICCSGVCLTVVSHETRGDRTVFDVDVSAETLRCTSLGDWAVGHPINLERSLKVGDELGGHIVTGHVDGIGRVAAHGKEGDSVRLDFAISPSLAPYLAQKGSIAIDGTSLTVNGVKDDADASMFWVNIIPHTLEKTTLSKLDVGSVVNLEIDVMARYVARMADYQKGLG